MNAHPATDNIRPNVPASNLADVVLRIEPLPTRVVGPAAPDTLLFDEEDELAEVALASQRRRIFDSSYLPASEDRFLIH